jgi:hypothetical protein
MTWNLLHLARMLKDAGGIPAHGNQRSAWDVLTSKEDRRAVAEVSLHTANKGTGPRKPEEAQHGARR